MSNKESVSGSYSVVSECSGVQGRTDRPGHLLFVLLDKAKPTLEEQQLRRDIEITAAALRKCLQQNAPSNFRARFDSLVSLAQMGLISPKANVREAYRALDDLKADLVLTEGQEIRTRYLWKLMTLAMFFCAFFSLTFLFAKHVSGLIIQDLAAPADPIGAQERAQTLTLGIQSYSIMLFTAMVGLWSSFALRRNFTFEHLFLPENDLLSPLHRILFVICATGILALFCSLNIATITIAKFSTQNLAFSFEASATFGVLCGLSQDLLADTILPRTKQFANVLAQTNKRGAKGV